MQVTVLVAPASAWRAEQQPGPTYRFTGKEDHTLASAVSIGARQYLPALGRWASPDRPDPQFLLDPEAQLARPGERNLYVYAGNGPDRRFFLVIDEINRGDLPRIFGELLTLLEADKRGWAVTLALSQERFVVPPNVAILATMNTADRSIALLDAALRRRFAFHELMPDPAALGDSIVLGLPLGHMLGWINEALVRTLGEGMRHLQVGHAYLMHNRQPISDPARLAAALRNDILPLLEEYCHDQRPHLRSIVGAGLFRGSSLEVDITLFEPANRERLGSALREHFAERLRAPEIVDLLARNEGPEDES